MFVFPLYYALLFSIALLAIGIGGIIASRHLIILILSAELVLAAAMVAAASFLTLPGGNADQLIILMAAIWAIASVEIMVLVAFYMKMRRNVSGYDVGKLRVLRG
jgi:NADH:ubiquinone oxidoreductase subunit K